jgi:hypothetical protein
MKEEIKSSRSSVKNMFAKENPKTPETNENP